MNNISKQDFIIWNNKINMPSEELDVVYHYTTIIEMINDGFIINKDEQIICVASLSLDWQRKINEAIENTK